MDENGEQEMKLQSKKKFDFGGNRRLQKNSEKQAINLGFMEPVNKNQEEEKTESKTKGTLLYMLKNPPPPKTQKKRKVIADEPEDDIEKPNKRMKVEISDQTTERVIKTSSLSKYAYKKSSMEVTVYENSEIGEKKHSMTAESNEQPQDKVHSSKGSKTSDIKIKNTQFGISNSDNHVKMTSSMNLVDLMKLSLEKP